MTTALICNNCAEILMAREKDAAPNAPCDDINAWCEYLQMKCSGQKCNRWKGTIEPEQCPVCGKDCICGGDVLHSGQDGKAVEPDHVPRIAEVASVLREFRENALERFDNVTDAILAHELAVVVAYYRLKYTTWDYKKTFDEAEYKREGGETPCKCGHPVDDHEPEDDLPGGCCNYIGCDCEIYEQEPRGDCHECRHHGIAASGKHWCASYDVPLCEPLEPGKTYCERYAECEPDKELDWQFERDCKDCEQWTDHGIIVHVEDDAVMYCNEKRKQARTFYIKCTCGLPHNGNRPCEDYKEREPDE
jgi:hypothetical protein